MDSFSGYGSMILDCVNACDVDLRKDLYSNIVICGGNSLLGSLNDQL
jgi:actin-related protein